jgi:hypothetical protein
LSIAHEFAGADLGDSRLTKRLLAVAEAIHEHPDRPFPALLGKSAELEGFYRFLSNDNVTLEAVLQPHIEATVERAARHQSVVVAHDTSEFRFEGQGREGLGRLGSKGQGFLGHFGLLISADGRREPLGVAGLKIWTRQGPTASQLIKAKKLSNAASRGMRRESARWGELVEEVEETVDGSVSLIHVMDSEADDYALMSLLVGKGRRFVIRLCYDRCLAQAEADAPGKLKRMLQVQRGVCTRTVKLSRRGRRPLGGQKRLQPRDERSATLAFGVHQASLRKPELADDDAPKQLDINIVHVWEVDPPAGVEAVEWILATTERVETAEQLLAVVDAYRARWVIEEYFKALKTGCAYEKRQLESQTTLQNALALLIPVAWNLLRLRLLARDEGEQAANTVLSESQLEVLRRATTVKLSETPTIQEAMLAVAQLGGHIRQNGWPGWQVLGRGYTKLLTLELGFLLALDGRLP